MDHFETRDGRLFCEQVPLQAIAEQVGTPTYVYSRATLTRHLQVLQEAFADYPTLLCFAVKANSNLAILREVGVHGYGGDVVSIGELKRCQIAGIEPSKMVYSGVGKRRDEIAAALDLGILSFNVESEFELTLISQVAAQQGAVAPISLRINPNIDAKTNPKITTGMYSTKFGITEKVSEGLADAIAADDNLKLVGLACHIGSQMTELQPLQEAASRMVALSQHFMAKGHRLSMLNMGGGLGIRYDDESPPSPLEYAKVLIDIVRPTGLRLVVEPGRVLMGNVGILLTRVLGVKETPSKTFVVVDAAMNDLLRPSMYDAFHQVEFECNSNRPPTTIDVVGPICESADYLAQERTLPVPMDGSVAMIRGCGAYAASMSSNYNSRQRGAEVMVDGDDLRIIKPRQSIEDLWQGEG